MTSKPHKEAPDYSQGYWVEFQKQRMAGGVSAEAQNWEGGLGAVINGQLFGLTGYVQYSLEFLTGRFQIDLLSNKEWLPQFTVGVPIQIKDFKVEPHLKWSLDKDYPTNPRVGLRVQYVF
mgnify:CR=1 FL=1